MKCNKRLAAVLIVPFLAALAAQRGAAQTLPPVSPAVIPPTQAQGTASGLSVGLNAVSGSNAYTLRIRSPGAASGDPVVWTSGTFSAAGANHPDYSMSALCQWLTTAYPAAPLPTFGGISTGGETMPEINANGELQMTSGNWYALSISVDGNADGATSGSMVALRAAGPRNPGGDIFSYYAIGSQAIHPDLVNTVRLEYSREQLQLPSLATSPVTELRDFDYGIGVISADPLNRAGSVFPERNLIYFTFTQAWVALVKGMTPAPQIAGAPPTASTIYGMEWQGSAWSAPFVAFSQNDLFGAFNLTGAALGALEIDALSVDRGTGTGSGPAPSRCVFSLTPANNASAVTGGGTVSFDQLLVYQRYPTTFNTVALKTQPNSQYSATNFSAALGLKPYVAGPGGEPDNVTGTCGRDPREPYVIKEVVGVATDMIAQGAGDLGFTMHRTDTPSDPTDKDILHLEITGLDYRPYDLGFIQLYLEDIAYPPGGQPKAAVEWGDPFWIDPSSEALNVFKLPLEVAKKPGGSTLRLSARIIGLTLSPFNYAELRESWVVTIKI